MLFTSSRFGNVEVEESDIIEFPHGLPGLEHCTRFKLFHDAEQTTPQVFWLQSLDDADILLSVVDPVTLGLRYEIELSTEEEAALKLTDPADIAVLVMVYKDQPLENQDPAQLVAPLKSNFRNPLLLNVTTRRGLQKTSLGYDIVLHNHAR